MLNALEKAKVFLEALPYLKAYDRRFVVIKIGGSTMTDDKILPSVVRDVVYLEQVGIWPILVHGGGPRITEEMERRGMQATFVKGRRVTDEATLEIAQKVLIEEISANVVRLIEKEGGKAIPLNGRGSGYLRCHKKIFAEDPTMDLGFVGEIDSSDSELAHRMLLGGIIPVVAPIARGPEKQLYNVNADSVAWKIASELKAEKLIYLSNVPGILRDKNKPESLISSATLAECDELMNTNVIVGGMIPKIEACMAALQNGVKKTHVISGLQEHSLLLEIFTPEGIGTEIRM
ncbi:MAG TPA: acetylglutamate kinase [Planctomycetota bacterium]|nr:acetylglutamate kinase [Planctomycetota bacterium]